MASRKSALKTALVSLGLFVCLILFAIASITFYYWRKSKLPPLGEGPLIEYPLGKTAQSEAQNFLDHTFYLVKEVRNLPVPVLQAFTEQGGSRLLMANPWENFRATDVVYDPTLPSKRLIFAGVSGEKCFVHYEQGGLGHSYILALFEVPTKDSMKPIWRGYCGGRANSLEDLRSWLRDGSCSSPR